MPARSTYLLAYADVRFLLYMGYKDVRISSNKNGNPRVGAPGQ